MNSKENRELLEIMTSLAREIRCCSREQAFCEGVTFQQFIILDAVVKNNGIFLSDLHDFLSVEKSTTTRLVNPLVANGYLRRESAPHDSRAIKLVLTADGINVHKRVWLCLSGFFERVIANLPKSERKSVFQSVKAFTGAIRGVLDEKACCHSNKKSVTNG